MKALFILLGLFVSFPLFSQDITGVWKGTLNMGAVKLELYFTVQSVDSEYKASMSVPQQGLVDLPLDSAMYHNSELILVNNALNMKYTGKYVDGSFLGEFAQHGFKAPMNLKKGEAPKQNRPQEPIRPFPYKEENIIFNNEKHNIKLAGTLTIPNGNGPFPAVVLISGSGYQDRNEEILGHKPFLVIADYLTRNGIVVLRFDDRGVGESGGTTKDNTSDDLSYDAQAAFDYLKTRNDISKIGLCGHSEGGMITFMVAARNPKVDFVISMAGTALSGAEILLSQQRAIGMAQNIPAQMLDNIEKINSGYYDIILNAKANDEIFRGKLRAKISENKAVTQRNISDIITTYTDPWMYYFIRHNPFEDIKKIEVPILALNGTVDLQVLPDLNLPKIEQAAQISGNSNVRVVYLEGLNHLFQHSKTGSPTEYGVIEETISVEVLEVMKKWILEQQ